MDKTINVSFTGLTNIAGINFSRTQYTSSRSLSMVLIDDFKGKDLTVFKNVIAKTKNSFTEYKNPVSRDILNIECVSQPGNEYNSAMYINGHFVETNDDNLPIFSYIARLSKQIAGMPEKNMIVNRDYKKYMADETLIYGVSLKDNFPHNADTEKLTNSFFDTQAVKATAQYVNDFVQGMMNRYFGVK